ncbi:MAG: tRNA (adenosine(37)-N6)-dimethylallyltransferase MiaA [Muribaculaceae bacterium]|nr:tRNA (adenosine(37)-N6)-dimethylallyltransferase MiaA [Muribaculaceae bacterium]
MAEKTLIVITGPTGIGKTKIAIEVAKYLDTEIISADSRQIFRSIPIGTACPTSEELATVKHHFINILNLNEYYSAAQFENDALKQLSQIFATHDHAVMCGGSMMYVDAVCNGIDDIPTVSDEIRSKAYALLDKEGIEGIAKRVAEIDPEYYAIVDKQNAKRLVHALEIYMQSGKTFSSFRTGEKKKRPFRILKFALNMPREELFNRINTRVDKMIESGLEEEARNVYHLRHLNSLNTVGYKEMFAYFDGTMDFTTACERLKKNTRVYAKKQLTWYAKDPDIITLHPATAVTEILSRL